MSVPPRSHRAPAAARARGQAMLLTVLLLGVAVAGIIYSLSSPATLKLEADKRTASALAMARDALIGRAAADRNMPGSLPCPDTDEDGSAELFSVSNHCPRYLGRLPWRTLGLPDLRDGSGERLWYALSSNFRDDSTASPLNSETPGQLTINGAAPDVVAIIFAPGVVVGAQSRAADTSSPCATTGTTIPNSQCAANYLEGENATEDTNYATALASATFNDTLLPISRDALFSVVEMRVLRELRAALRTYRMNNGYFPGANPYTDGTYSCGYFDFQGRPPLNISLDCPKFANWGAELPAWFGNNNWQTVTYYAVGPCRLGEIGGFLQSALNALCTFLGDHTLNGTPVHALAFTAGRAVTGQARPSTGVQNYLDPSQGSNENQNTDFTFISPVRSATNNDRVVVVWP